MNKFVFKLFWSYDVAQTEKWLSEMNAKGYGLKKIHFKTRIFEFERIKNNKIFYRIVLEKKSNGAPLEYIENNQYEEVFHSKNYYVLKTENESVEILPSYNNFLSKNRKLRFFIGLFLAVLIPLSLPLFMIGIVAFIAIINGNYSVEPSPAPVEPPTLIQIVEGTLTLAMMVGLIIFIIWCIYTFFKLKRTNKELEKLCGDDLDLALTIPKDTILGKTELKRLQKDNKLFTKVKLAWHYAPDKIEIWLEKMEGQGYNLIQMSKLGAKFYFIKGKPRKMKYHIDYQNMTNPTYYNINKENGWKLIFTSITRIQSTNVWCKEYEDIVPEFYSDKESKLKNARRIALTYALCYFPLCILYIALIIFIFMSYKENGFTAELTMFYILPILWTIIIIEYSVFATKSICYYFRIKKQMN